MQVRQSVNSPQVFNNYYVVLMSIPFVIDPLVRIFDSTSQNRYSAVESSKDSIRIYSNLLSTRIRRKPLGDY